MGEPFFTLGLSPPSSCPAPRGRTAGRSRSRPCRAAPPGRAPRRRPDARPAPPRDVDEGGGAAVAGAALLRRGRPLSASQQLGCCGVVGGSRRRSAPTARRARRRARPPRARSRRPARAGRCHRRLPGLCQRVPLEGRLVLDQRRPGATSSIATSSRPSGSASSAAISRTLWRLRLARTTASCVLGPGERVLLHGEELPRALLGQRRPARL